MSSEKEENDMGIYKRRDNIKSYDLKKVMAFLVLREESSVDVE